MSVNPKPLYGEKNDPWQCPICGKRYVVPGLTKDCIARHEKQTQTVDRDS